MKVTPKRGTCRSCGAQVLWVVMAKSGRRAPLDAEPVEIPADKPERSLYVIVADGSCLGIRGRRGHRSHFETCPQGRAWKKPDAPAAKPAAQGGLFA